MRERDRIDSATSDPELATAFAARAPGALAEAYARHADTLYSVARSQGANSQDAQDCVHDTISHIWFASESYRTERGSLRSFLSVCVRNAALSRRRSAARHATIETQHARLDFDARPFEDDDPVQRAQLRAALAALPAEQRTVIELAFSGERTQAQIAAALDVPLGTVKSRISLGLRKLALALGSSQK